jgi:hypothetical protein
VEGREAELILDKETDRKDTVGKAGSKAERGRGDGRAKDQAGKTGKTRSPPECHAHVEGREAESILTKRVHPIMLDQASGR